MRKVALVLAGLLIGGAISWQVAIAQDGTPLTTLCTRTGADVRTPASNGSCPSGYTKVVIPAPTEPVDPEPTFETDEGENLTFRFSVDVQVVSPSVIFRPFVVSPDGDVRESLLELDTLGVISAQDVVQNPEFGTWVIGCHVIGAGDVPTMRALVETSRDDEITTLPPIPCFPNIAPDFIDNTQASTTFAYGPSAVP
jgi:hypothetical protein